MIKTKNAQVLVYGLIFGFFIAIGTFYIASYMKDLPKDYLGEKSLNIIKSASEADKALLYADLSAKYAAQHSIFEIANRGGFYRDKCGEYIDYYLLNNENKEIEECFPDYEENFKLIFNNNLNSYLLKHPGLVPTNNYQIILKQNDNLNIYGIALTSLEINKKEKKRLEKNMHYCCICGGDEKGFKCGINCNLESIQSNIICSNHAKGKGLNCRMSFCKGQDETVFLAYQIKPSFTTKVDFNLDVFDEIKEKATELIENCTNVDEKEKCVKKKIAEYNLVESKKENPAYWALNCDKKELADENKYVFCVDTNKKINNEKAVIKFALYFP